MSIDSINSLSSKNSITLKKSKNVNFRSQTNNLERAPQEDTLEKQGMSTGAKIAIATAVAAGLFAAGDAIFNHGKNLKKIFGKAEEVAKDSADDAASGAETKVKTEAERIKDKKAALAKKNKARLEKRSEVKAEKNARKEAKAAMKARAEEKAILAEAKKNEELVLKQKKAQLASEGKLNFEVNVGDNRIIVKNGEIAECINAHNQKWMIDDKTAPEFVEQVQKAVDDKIGLVIKEEKEIQQKLTGRYASELKYQEAIKQNEEKTARAIVKARSGKSAEESAKVFALGAEVDDLQKYCSEKYGKAMKEDLPYLYQDITEKFPEAKITKHKNGTMSYIVKKDGYKIKYTADEYGTIERVNHYKNKLEDGFVVHIEKSDLVATSLDEEVKLASNYFFDKDGYYAQAHGKRLIKPKEIEFYSYKPITEKSKSTIRIHEDWQGDRNRVAVRVENAAGEKIDIFKNPSEISMKNIREDAYKTDDEVFEEFFEKYVKKQ